MSGMNNVVMTDIDGGGILTKVNHYSDTLKKIDDRRKSIFEVNMLSKELEKSSRLFGGGRPQSDHAVFAVLPELGINSDFERLKKKLEKIDVSRSSREIQDLHIAIKNHLKEFLRFYRLLKSATPSTDLSSIPATSEDLPTLKEFRLSLRGYLLKKIIQACDGETEHPFDKRGMKALVSVINDHETLASSASAETRILLNELEELNAN